MDLVPSLNFIEDYITENIINIIGTGQGINRQIKIFKSKIRSLILEKQIDRRKAMINPKGGDNPRTGSKSHLTTKVNPHPRERTKLETWIEVQSH